MDIISFLDSNHVTVTADINTCRSIMSDKRSLKILSLNIRSINCNFDNLILMIQDLQSDLDIIILTEAWIGNSFVEKQIKGYSTFYTKNNYTQNDGVIAYVNHTIQNATVSEVKLEGANCLQINLNNTINIIGVYRSPSVSNISIFLETLDNLLRKNVSNDLVLCGDLNISLCGKKHNQVNDYLEVMTLHGLHCLVNKPTRGNNCLDHVMCRSKLQSATIIYETAITDHYPIMVKLSQYKTDTVIHKNVFKKTKIDLDKVLYDLGQVDWTPVYSANNVDYATEYFIQTLTSIADNNTCTQSYVISHKNKKIKPWITDGLLFCIRRRDKLHIASKNNPDNLTLKSKFVIYRNLCKRLIKKTKEDYYKNKIAESNSDPKKVWQLIKEAANISNNTHTIDKLVVENRVVTAPENLQEIVNIFNTHFASVGSTLANKILDRKKIAREDKNSTKEIPNSAFSLIPTSPIEVSKSINSLKQSRSSGMDCLNSDIYKIGKDYLSSPISTIINLSFKLGIFPTRLKCAKIVPVFKCGDKLDLNNYRPISLLSTLSKIIEKIVKNRLVDYLDSNSILSSNQYGFRQEMGTADAIAEVTKTLTELVDKGEKCLAIFLDLSKAFDTVAHDILLKRLLAIGVKDNNLKWFESYISERTQLTSIADIFSDVKSLPYGVPQGSVLGPILFLIYINDLYSLTPSKAISFADDTVIIFNSSSWQQVFTKANNEMDIVKEWLDDSLLTLNIEKTKYLAFSIDKRGQPPDANSITIHQCMRRYQCNCEPLQKVLSLKYLGIVVDNKLRWADHIDLLSSRIRRLAYIFKDLRNILDPKTLKTTYYALCQSILSYGIIGWGGCAKTIMQQVEVAQKLIIKIINRKPYRYPSEKLFEEFDVLEVRQLYLKCCLVFIQFQNNKVPTQQVHRTRRSVMDMIDVRGMKTSFGQRHLVSIGPRAYNKLDESIKIVRSKDQFKKRCHRWLMNEGRHFSHQIFDTFM